MTLNGLGDRIADRRRAARQQLHDALLDELTAWGPGDRVRMFKRWHQGAFSLINLMVLTTLESGGPRSMSGLAEALDVSVASVTGIIDRMESRGLVERSHATADRRVILVGLTPRGRDVFDEVDARRRERLERLLDRMTTRERAGLLMGMRAMRRAAEVLRADGEAAQARDATTPAPTATAPAATAPSATGSAGTMNGLVPERP